MRYSAFSLVRNALSGNLNWKPHWRQPQPKSHYDVIIVGGGGHGLSTAYYLAKEFGVKNVAVLEKGYLGSGNVGRNTTIVRSNYMLPGNEPFYEFSMKLWEGLEQDLNYNVMLSQRGVIMLYHSDAQRDAYVRRGNAMWMEGVAAELIEREQLKKTIPFLNYDHARYPILGGLLQRRAGTARHDAVAWGYARGADQHGVDIIEHCEVTGIRRENGVVTGVETTKGFIGCGKLALAAAGNTSRVGEMADLKLPLESHVLQAFVTEGLKPCIDHVIVYGGGHFYISQSDKGGLVFGAEIDGYSSYAQRGNLATAEHVMEEGVTMIPGLSRVRVLRAWGGVMDMSMDGSPIIDRTSIDNLYLNCGWCYGGFKATPASGYCFAHLIAKNDTHPVARALRLDRFARGYAVDEAGAGPQPNLH
ncbi:sarcosine oxidase subunit beta family protein [Ensifer sp. PDNC004]|uniref:sarcosine oxidase subunit beta family protein n=1 Tax=Ensifer sp. PDNC004 TaxID=2811423 RepID=UPI00196399DD|nr:sarcosine oxidase subunit beta family protein [Ensifer sp. PDNC004]QRY67863.1 sarcosine oxidase subunit beta family protein [Ensifer sp. PDNC004]